MRDTMALIALNVSYLIARNSWLELNLLNLQIRMAITDPYLH